MPAEQYPADWDERRRDVYQRDNYECQICGAQGGRAGDTELHAHHVTPISEGGSHRRTNLTTLCKSCHNNQHSHDITGGRRRSRSYGDVAGSLGITDSIVGGLIILFVFPYLYYSFQAAFLILGAENGLTGWAIAFLVCSGIGWYTGRSIASSVIATSYAIWGALTVIILITNSRGFSTLWRSVQISDIGSVFAPTLVDLSIIVVLLIPGITSLLRDHLNVVSSKTNDENSTKRDSDTTDHVSGSYRINGDAPTEAVEWSEIPPVTAHMEMVLHRRSITSPVDVQEKLETIRRLDAISDEATDALEEFAGNASEDASNQLSDQ